MYLFNFTDLIIPLLVQINTLSCQLDVFIWESYFSLLCSSPQIEEQRNEIASGLSVNRVFFAILITYQRFMSHIQTLHQSKIDCIQMKTEKWFFMRYLIFVHDNSPILSMKIRLLCPRELCHPKLHEMKFKKNIIFLSII